MAKAVEIGAVLKNRHTKEQVRVCGLVNSVVVVEPVEAFGPPQTIAASELGDWGATYLPDDADEQSGWNALDRDLRAERIAAATREPAATPEELFAAVDGD